ncbi:MAG: hypothetical protein KC414_12215, partial [Romboutsia sp.]|nr:hypothetical protein [Romboutsia sp.]
INHRINELRQVMTKTEKEVGKLAAITIPETSVIHDQEAEKYILQINKFKQEIKKLINKPGSSSNQKITLRIIKLEESVNKQQYFLLRHFQHKLMQPNVDKVFIGEQMNTLQLEMDDTKKNIKDLKSMIASQHNKAVFVKRNDTDNLETSIEEQFPENNITITENQQFVNDIDMSHSFEIKIGSEEFNKNIEKIISLFNKHQQLDPGNYNELISESVKIRMSQIAHHEKLFPDQDESRNDLGCMTRHKFRQVKRALQKILASKVGNTEIYKEWYLKDNINDKDSFELCCENTERNISKNLYVQFKDNYITIHSNIKDLTDVEIAICLESVIEAYNRTGDYTFNIYGLIARNGSLEAQEYCLLLALKFVQAAAIVGLKITFDPYTQRLVNTQQELS